MQKTRIYVAVAKEDQEFRDRLCDQFKNPFSTFEVTDGSMPGPVDVGWKTACQDRLRKTDLMIVLIGPDTARDEGVVWEIFSAKALGLPNFGVYVEKEKKYPVPTGLTENQAIEWTWDGISNLIKTLMQNRRPWI